MDVHYVEANPQGGKPHIIPSLRCDLIQCKILWLPSF